MFVILVLVTTLASKICFTKVTGAVVDIQVREDSSGNWNDYYDADYLLNLVQQYMKIIEDHDFSIKSSINDSYYLEDASNYRNQPLEEICEPDVKESYGRSPCEYKYNTKVEETRCYQQSKASKEVFTQGNCWHHEWVQPNGLCGPRPCRPGLVYFNHVCTLMNFVKCQNNSYLSVHGYGHLHCQCIEGYYSYNNGCYKEGEQGFCPRGRHVKLSYFLYLYCRRDCPDGMIYFDDICTDPRTIACSSGMLRSDGTKTGLICSCDPYHYYHRGTDRCYKEGDQAFCDPGHYVEYNSTSDSLHCVCNPCGFNYIYKSGRCYKIIFIGFCKSQDLVFHDLEVDCYRAEPVRQKRCALNLGTKPKTNWCPEGEKLYKTCCTPTLKQSEELIKSKFSR